ncbi:transmembrane protein 135-like [Chelonus insularis]|uniref:transmembrane protein 135-like n=1 Tax=Chelonus insularis TaxID=460826 RepID=UPI001588D95F|nr:transmembrane protein 135-like [Chelonus insularis]
MPAKLSKFIVETANCKDYVHPWVNSCVMAQVGLGLHALQESLRVYSTVYILTLLMRGKTPSKNDILRTILGILQSTAFLSWSALTYPAFICLLRRILGHFNILTVSFLPAFLSSLSAILIERPSRRPLLCLYVANIATETLFRMGVWRGYFKEIPYANVGIFAASMATLLYFFRSKSSKQDSIFKIIKLMVGPYENPDYVETRRLSPEPSTSKHEDNPFSDKISSRIKLNTSLNLLQKSLKTYRNLINWIKCSGKHRTCPHPYSCSSFILGGSIKLFSIGLCIQLGLKLAFQVKQLLSKPGVLKAELCKKDNFNLALFLGGFSGIYRLLSCLLRRTFNKNSKMHAIPAGLLASVAFLMFPNNTIALYVMWKALQLSWNKGVENRIVPEVKWFVIFLYCFSTAVLFHAAIIEPQNLRASYWKFLLSLSGGRVAAMARVPLDPFGLESSKYVEEVMTKTKTPRNFNFSF